MEIRHLLVAGAAAFSLGTFAMAQQQGQGAQQDRSARQDTTAQQERGGERMQAGRSAAPIREVQQALRQMGHDPGPADGQWGPKTQRALRDFQQERGLQASGRLDQATLGALHVSGTRSVAGTAQPGASATGAGRAAGGTPAASAGGSRPAAGTEPRRSAPLTQTPQPDIQPIPQTRQSPPQ
jgi:peptidoglycan hydrolase-like protein with peptidoglycan-binding domain